MTAMKEKNVLRWGGLAGILGSLLMIFVFVFVGVIVGADPAGLEGPVSRFPDVQVARTVENSLYLLVLVLWVPFFLAMYRVLRETSVAAALFGSVFGVLGLVVLAAGTLPHFVESRISALYHAPGATPGDRASLVLLWEANQGLFDALLAVGLALVPIGILVLGVGMVGAPAFGRGFGGAGVVLGLGGIVAAAIFVAEPLSPSVFGVFLALIIFNLALGWKLFSLSRAPKGVLTDPQAPPVTGSRVGPSKA